MSTNTTAQRARLAVRLHTRDQLANDAISALAHGVEADDLWTSLTALEEQLEADAKYTVARKRPVWMALEADLLARHQADSVSDCPQCRRDSGAGAPASPVPQTA